MISLLSCGFTDRGSGRLLDRGALVLTVADPCIWHGYGTNLSRRQLATMAGAPTDHARVCLASPLPVSAKVLGCCRPGLRRLAASQSKALPFLWQE